MEKTKVVNICEKIECKHKKLLNLLKEKKVDLDYIREMLYYEYEHELIVELYVDRYNHRLMYYPTRHLTQEEMQTIVDWLKGE